MFESELARRCYDEEGDVLMKTIHLPDEAADALNAKAAAAGLTLEAWLKQLAGAEEAGRGPQRRRHISEIIRENMKRVPREVMDTMPKDGAREHDHFIYGLPKRKR